ncbi:MAG: hypothetical protein HYY62_09525 [Deltaproteobacteria bacterium]|nr:hypothetical protein [Deltaproteobacteria bacterium]
MRFKVLLLILGTLFLSACSSSWFGEDPPEIPQLKINYMKNDSETILCFKIIDIQYAHFLDGKLSPDGFVKMIDCSELLLLKGASHIELKTKDTFTAEEISRIMNSGVLGESANVEKWVKRFVALERVLYGSETESITMPDILEVFRRIRRIAPYVSKLSKLMHDQNQLSSVSLGESPKYWSLRKEIFMKLLEAARDLVKDNEFPLVGEILIHQREYFDLGIRQETWDRFVKACFIVNKAILGRSEDVIESRDIISILNILDFSFQKVFDVYGIYATQVWTPKEWVLIIKSYEELLAKFLDAFSENKAQEIKAQDLARILSLVHVGTQEEANTFVDALVDLKTNIFKSSGSSFSRQDVKELRQFLHEAIEEAHETDLHSKSLQALDTSKIKHLWKSPFTKKDSLKTEEEELSALLLHFIDHVIRMHDADQDGKLSVYSQETSSSGEMVYKELSALMHMVQKMVMGFRKLMGESGLLSSVEQVGADTIGKIVISVSDKLLVNSDQDGKLSRYEILELMSFATETDRLVSDLIQQGTFNTQGLKGLYRNPILREHFPRLFQVFLNFEDFKEYMKFYLTLLNKDDVGSATLRTMTAGELKIIFGLMRLVEYIFLKFDTNQDHILVKAEMGAAYSVFNALVGEVVAYLKATGKNASFMDVGWLKAWWEIGTEAKVIEAVVVYAFTEGKIPSRLSQVIAGSSKSYATRVDIVRLFSETFSYLK